jgi:ParB family chromosome partitioning protein
VIAHGLTTHRREVGSAAGNGNGLAHTLLGIERGGYWDGDKLATMIEQSPAKAQHVALAVVLGGIEDSTSKNTWRSPNATARTTSGSSPHGDTDSATLSKS